MRLIEMTIPYSDSEWYEGKVKGHTAAASVHGTGWCKPHLSLLSLEIMMILVGPLMICEKGIVTDRDQ